MHDLLVVIGTVIGLFVLLSITRLMFDSWLARMMERRIRALALFLRGYDGAVSSTLCMVVVAELHSRLFMPKELKVEEEHSILINTIANWIVVLCQQEVRNQFEMLLVIASELNHQPNHKACVNITTTNRLELIVTTEGLSQPLYLKFHSTNTLF